MLVAVVILVPGVGGLNGVHSDVNTRDRKWLCGNRNNAAVQDPVSADPGGGAQSTGEHPCCIVVIDTLYCRFKLRFRPNYNHTYRKHVCPQLIICVSKTPYNRLDIPFTDNELIISRC